MLAKNEDDTPEWSGSFYVINKFDKIYGRHMSSVGYVSLVFWPEPFF